MALLLCLCIVFSVLTLGVQLYTGVPPCPSSKKEREALVSLLKKAPLEGKGPIYELGSAWGGLAMELHKTFPERKIVGIEASPLPYLWSKLRFFRHSQVEIRFKNFLTEDLSDAAAICTYLMQGPMEKLGEKLDKELMVQTPVVTIAFHYPQREVWQKIPGQGLFHATTALYLWSGAESREG